MDVKVCRDYMKKGTSESLSINLATVLLLYMSSTNARERF
jgi:hypothetical protein